MRSYRQLLVKTCHRRGAHAIGGMAAFIPSRRDAGVNAIALAKVREDKEREAAQGFDGTWVAHPDLVPVAIEAFDAVLGDRPNQIERLRDDVEPAPPISSTSPRRRARSPRTACGTTSRSASSISPPGSGVRRGRDLQPDGGCGHRRDLPLADLAVASSRQVIADDVRRITDEEVAKLGDGYEEARGLFDPVATEDDFVEFLTLPAYERLTATGAYLLRALDGYSPLTSKDTRDLVYGILSNDQRKRLEQEWQVDFSYSVPAHGRFRVNAYMQRASIGAAFRLIPDEIKTIEQLGLPPSCTSSPRSRAASCSSPGRPARASRPRSPR